MLCGYHHLATAHYLCSLAFYFMKHPASRLTLAMIGVCEENGVDKVRNLISSRKFQKRNESLLLKILDLVVKLQAS